MENLKPEEILNKIDIFRTEHNLPKDERVKPLNDVEIGMYPELPNGWKWVLINDISEFITNGVHTPTSPEDTNGLGLHCLRITDIQSQNDICYDSLPYCLRITKGDYDKKLRKGDIYFSFTGNVLGKRYLVTEDRNDTVFAHYFVRWHPIIVNPYYVYYVTHSKVYDIFINAHTLGSTQPNLKVTDLKRFPIPLCDLVTQNKIAGVLKAIDRKIHINNQINQNLVQQLELIYNEMYPYDTDAIPDGWRSVHLGDVCESISVKHDFKKDELIFLNTGDIKNGCFLHSNYSAVESMPGQAKKTIKKDDILYSEIRPINRHYAYVSFNAEDYVVSTKLMVIRAKGIDSRRLYHYLTSKSVIDELQHEAEARSGTFPQIRFDNIQRLKMIIAPPEQEKAFCEILHAYYRKIDANIAENERLSLLRDSILPKLMSGELDVS